MMSNKTNFKTHVLVTLKNLTRSLTARLEDEYCSITVANHRLIISIFKKKLQIDFI